MKKLTAIVLACSMAIALAACGSTSTSTSTATTTSTAASTSKSESVASAASSSVSAAVSEVTSAASTSTDPSSLTIGYSYPTANNEFWGNALTYVKQCSEALGFKLQADDCNNDQAEQVTDVEAMVNAGISGLVLGPQDASVVPGILDECKAKNIPVAIIDRWPGDDLTAGKDYLCFIGPDDEIAGYNIAMSLINAGCTKLVGLGGYQGTSVAEGRKAGLDKALSEHPEVKLLQFDYVGENTDDGDTGMRNLLQANPDLDGVWCYNDSLALASVNVLKENNLIPSVKVGGMDLLSPAIDSMKANELWFSTGGHYYQAAFASCIVFDTLMGNKYTGDSVVKLKLLAVSQDNLSDYEAKYGSGNAIDWKKMSKVYNKDASYTFELTL